MEARQLGESGKHQSGFDSLPPVRTPQCSMDSSFISHRLPIPGSPWASRLLALVRWELGNGAGNPFRICTTGYALAPEFCIAFYPLPPRCWLVHPGHGRARMHPLGLFPSTTFCLPRSPTRNTMPQAREGSFPKERDAGQRPSSIPWDRLGR